MPLVRIRTGGQIHLILTVLHNKDPMRRHCMTSAVDELVGERGFLTYGASGLQKCLVLGLVERSSMDMKDRKATYKITKQGNEVLDILEEEQPLKTITLQMRIPKACGDRIYAAGHSADHGFKVLRVLLAKDTKWESHFKKTQW